MWIGKECPVWKNQDWLDAGGAEIVLEVVSRMGWTVTVMGAEKWVFQPDIISAGDSENHTIEVDGTKKPYLQAVAVVATAVNEFFRQFDLDSTEWKFPMFHVGEKLYSSDAGEIERFIETVRYSSEATSAVIRAAENIRMTA